MVACALELPDPAWLPADVVVPVCALELPDPAWLPLEVVVPVWALAPPEPAWLPVDVVVPVWALEVADPAWFPLGVVVPVWALVPPEPAWLPVDVVVPVWALEVADPAWFPLGVVVPVWALVPPEPAWLPVDVVVPVCALASPAGGLLEVVEVDGAVVVDVLFVWRLDVPPVDLFGGEEDGGVGVDVHRVVYVLVVLPDVFDPEAETAVVGGLGAVTAEVVDDVSVLDVPPFTVGCTLNWGLTLMIGWTVITGAEIALETPLIFIARPCDARCAAWP